MKKGVLAIMAVFFGAAGGFAAGKFVSESRIKDGQKLSDKNRALYLLMNQWIRTKQEGKTIESYFVKMQYKEIAIYGMDYVGEILVKELKESSVKIKYVIDQNAALICSDFDVFLPNDELKEADAIVVTPITYYEEIQRNLKRKVDCPIISIEDILYNI